MLQAASEQHLDTAVFTTEEWDNHQKNTVYLDSWEQYLVFWDYLEQLIIEKGDILEGGGYQAVLGTAHRAWPTTHISQGGLDNPFYPGSLIYQ